MYNLDKFEVDHSVTLRRNLQNLLVHMNQVDSSIKSITFCVDELRVNDNYYIKSPKWVFNMWKYTYDVKLLNEFKLS